MPPALAASTLASLKIIQNDTARRDRLHQRIAQFRQGCEAGGISLMPSDSPIQPVLLGDDKVVLDAANRLKSEGILVGAIRPPTVPEGAGRLRITLSATHTEANIDQLIQALTKVLVVKNASD